MLTKSIKMILFLSSYAPLLFIFAIQNQFNNTYVQWTLIAIGVLSIITLRYVLFKTNQIEGSPEKVGQVNLKDGESMSYIVTYLVPFLTVDYSQTANVAAILLMFGMLAVLYMNSNLIYTNPVLNLFGYHIYEIQIENGSNIMLLTKKNQIMVKQTINISQLDNNIYIGG